MSSHASIISAGEHIVRPYKHFMSSNKPFTIVLSEAMKDRKPEVVDALRGLQAAIKNKAIDLRRDLDDAEVVDVLKTASKQLKDAMGDFVKSRAAGLDQQNKSRAGAHPKFLPTPMERAEIRKHVVALAADVGATTMKDMGKLMGAVVKAVGATANGEDVRAEVEEYLFSHLSPPRA